MSDPQSVNLREGGQRLQENRSSIQTLSQRSMFWRPNYLEQSAWLEHIPFAFWLIQSHQPRVMVELGTHYGVSYFALCQAVDRLGLATRCFAVDTWEGDEHAGFYGGEVFKRVNCHNEAQYSSFSRLVRSSFDDALNYFEDDSIDLLHIDGLHTLEAVTHDFESWLPKLSTCGVVIMHDTNVRERGFGVFKLFSALKERYPHFEFVHGHGLGVLGVGSEQSDLLTRLFQCSVNGCDSQAVQEVFGRLGRACADSLHLAKTNERARALGGQVDKRERQLEGLKTSLEKAKSDLKDRGKELKDTKRQIADQQEQHAAERGQLAERANLFKELGEELKAEATRLRNRIHAVSGELADKSSQALILSQEADKHKRELDSVRGRLAGADATEQELVGCKAKLAQAYDELSKSRTEQERFVELAKERGRRFDKAQRAIDRRDEQLGQLRRDIEKQSMAHTETLEKARALASKESERNAELSNEIEILKGTERQRKPEDENAVRRLEEENGKLRRDNQVQAENIETRFDELAKLTKLLEERDAELRIKESTLEAERKRAQAAGRAVQVEADRREQLKDSVSWRMTAPIRAVGRVLKKRSTRSQEIERNIALIEKSGLFDRQWYTKEYPDVGESGIDPIEHYLVYGANEGRNPSLSFNTTSYRSKHIGITDSDNNPLVHYIMNQG